VEKKNPFDETAVRRQISRRVKAAIVGAIVAIPAAFRLIYIDIYHSPDAYAKGSAWGQAAEGALLILSLAIEVSIVSLLLAGLRYLALRGWLKDP